MKQLNAEGNATPRTLRRRRDNNLTINHCALSAAVIHFDGGACLGTCGTGSGLRLRHHREKAMPLC
jgi:hypothetical protein